MVCGEEGNGQGVGRGEPRGQPKCGWAGCDCCSEPVESDCIATWKLRAVSEWCLSHAPSLWARVVGQCTLQRAGRCPFAQVLCNFSLLFLTTPSFETCTFT